MELQNYQCFTSLPQLGTILFLMGSIVSKIADEIRLHGTWEAYQEWEKQRERENKANLLESEVSILVSEKQTPSPR